MPSDRLGYPFGPLERRGLLGPLRAGQVAVLGAGAVVAVEALDHAPTAGGAIVATLAFVMSIGLALWPVGKRTAEEWGPVAVSFLWHRVRRRSRFRSAAPSAGSTTAGFGARCLL